jgi:hypothetical protein
MVQARSICGKLLEEIHSLQSQQSATPAKRRFQADIDIKIAQLYLLIQGMSRFSFQ